MSSDEGILNEQIKSYSDQQLREKLTGLGMDVGPITGTTRKLYERKLVQLLTGNYPQNLDEADSSSPEKSPPKSPRKSPPKSPRRSPRVLDSSVPEPPTSYESVDEYPWKDRVQSPFETPSRDSTINLIRPRKPVQRIAVSEEPISDSPYIHQDTPWPAPISRRSYTQQATPFPAANAQFKKTESNGSFTDHILKFVLFGIVMVVIVYFIVNQEPAKALEHRS